MSGPHFDNSEPDIGWPSECRPSFWLPDN